MSGEVKANPMLLRRVIETLPRFAYRFSNEIELHEAMATVLDGAGIEYEREAIGGPRDRFDFLLPGGIVIEAKVKGSLSPALIQCARYLAREDVSVVLLVTTRFWGSQAGAQQYTSKAGKAIHIIQLKGVSF